MKINNKYVLSISYFNYRFALGGTDKFIWEQKKYYKEKGYTYVLVYSTNFLSSKLHMPKINDWVVMIDEIIIAELDTKNLISFLKNLDKQSELTEYIVNHLMQIPIDDLKNLFYNDHVKISFYIHDYYTLCPHSGLIDPKGMYCGKEKQNKDCFLFCCNEKEKTEADFTNSFVQLVKQFENRITMYFPSECAKKIWSQGYPELLLQKEVLPHYVIDKYVRMNARKIDDIDKINVAFIGTDLPHKGYKKWCEFVEKKKNDERYTFYHFGKQIIDLSGVKQVDVDYMIDGKKLPQLLSKYDIHCAVLWSLVPETYSYTYFESYSADCYVLTNEMSGNIANQVKNNMNGYVAKDVDGLYTFFSDKQKVMDHLRAYFGRTRQIPNGFKNNWKYITKNENKVKVHLDPAIDFVSVLKTKIYVLMENVYEMAKRIKR